MEAKSIFEVIVDENSNQSEVVSNNCGGDGGVLSDNSCSLITHVIEVISSGEEEEADFARETNSEMID